MRAAPRPPRGPSPPRRSRRFGCNLLSARRQRTTGDPERRLPCHPYPCPSAPSLEQLRKQAKDLLRAHRAGNPQAVARVAAHEPGEPLKLTGAQHVVAREHGFPSWTRLKVYVERLAAHGPDLEHAYHEDLDYYEGRAYGLHASARDGTERAVAAFAPLGRADPRGGRACRGRAPPRLRELGGAAPPRRGPARTGEPFARAYRAVEAHDLDGLRAQLETFPDLAAAVGTNGNDLLGMAGATCDERLVRVLLDAGADPTRGNAHGWTPLHQAAYSNLPLLARMLLDEGVPVDVSGARRRAARRWSSPSSGAIARSREVLAERGVHPRNLRAAAGLGRLDLVEELVRPTGAWRRGRCARAYYRPHSGFPTGTRRTIRRRSSTRRSPGRRAATASRCSSRSSRAARTSTPTSTAAAH